MNEKTPKSTSTRAFGRIPHEDETSRATLQSAIVDRLQRFNESLWPRALQWFENASYLLGNHTTRYYYDPAQGFGYHTFGLHDSSRYDTLIAKCADNRLIRPVETVVGMLTDNWPEPRVSPASTEPVDEDAAKVSERVVQLYFEHPLQMHRQSQEAVLIALTCGSVYAETQYGATGEPIEIPKYKVTKRKNVLVDPNDPNEPEFIEDLEQVGFDVASRNDVTCRLFTPMHLVHDGESLRDATWVARTTFEDIEWIQEEYGDGTAEDGYFPDEIARITSCGGEDHVLLYWMRLRDILESPQFFGASGMAPSPYGSSSTLPPDQTTFTVVDVRPSRQYPRGRTIVLAGGKIIYASPREVGARAWSEKYKWRWHPYSEFEWFRMAGRAHGVALLSFLVPLQKKINAIDALVHANRQYMAIGQWMIPRHARLAEGTIGGLPGQQWTYTAMQGLPGPERVPNQPLPGDLLEERVQLIEAIDLIAAAGLTNPDQVSASAARAGVMLDFMQGQKLQSKSATIRNFSAFIESIAQNILIEIQLNLTEEDPELTARLEAVCSDLPRAAIANFTGASLRDHHNVKIDISTALRHTPEAEAQRALEYLQYRQGNISPAEVNAVVRATGLDKFMANEQDEAINSARRTIAAIRAGDLNAFVPMPNVEDPIVMAAEYRRALLSPRARDLTKPQVALLAAIFDYYSAEAARIVAAQEERMARLAQSGVRQ